MLLLLVLVLLVLLLLLLSSSVYLFCKPPSLSSTFVDVVVRFVLLIVVVRFVLVVVIKLSKHVCLFREEDFD